MSRTDFLLATIFCISLPLLSAASPALAQGCPDADADTICDVDDNCPNTANPAQLDVDADGIGDVCDNCPVDWNPDQEDTDADGEGDVCDPDDDYDGILDDGDGSGVIGDNPCTGGQTTNCDDNCLADPNPLQEDTDGDGIGDPCDSCVGANGPDCDGDGIGDYCDACPDCDEDQVCDSCPPPGDPDYDPGCIPDNCPGVGNIDQADTDSDGVGDPCDNCELDPNPGQEDFDGDCLGDACDADDDDDDVPDVSDCAQFDPSAWSTPGEVRDVVFSVGPGTNLRWFETDPDDRYDLVGGTLAELLGGGGTDGAECLGDDVWTEAWDDTRPDPAPGEGFYYLVRGQSDCGNGPYGSDSSTLERHVGDDCP